MRDAVDRDFRQRRRCRKRPYIFAAEMFFVDGGSSESLRIFEDLKYRAKTWSSDRRMIVKAERLPDGGNPLAKENTRFRPTPEYHGQVFQPGVPVKWAFGDVKLTG